MASSNDLERLRIARQLAEIVKGTNGGASNESTTPQNEGKPMSKISAVAPFPLPYDLPNASVPHLRYLELRLGFARLISLRFLRSS